MMLAAISLIALITPFEAFVSPIRQSMRKTTHLLSSSAEREQVGENVAARRVVKQDGEKGLARMAKQDAIREIMNARKPNQRRDCVFPGTRCLLVLSKDIKDGVPIAETPMLYEATVEEVVSKERTHVLGIKVRAVGGKTGRVVHVLAPNEDAGVVAQQVYNSELSQITPNKGMRTQLLAQSAAGKKYTPYMVRGNCKILTFDLFNLNPC